MLDKRTLLAVVVGMFLVSPSAARGDDLADLQTAYKQYAAALSQQDADATMAFFHDGVAIAVGHFRSNFQLREKFCNDFQNL